MMPNDADRYLYQDATLCFTIGLVTSWFQDVPSEIMQYLDTSTHGTHWVKCMLIFRMHECDEIIETKQSP